MIRQPFAGVALLDVAEASGKDPDVLRRFAAATLNSGFRFAKNYAPGRERHVEFLTVEVLAAIRADLPIDFDDRLGELSRLDQPFGEMKPLCAGQTATPPARDPERRPEFIETRPKVADWGSVTWEEVAPEYNVPPRGGSLMVRHLADMRAKYGPRGICQGVC